MRIWVVSEHRGWRDDDWESGTWLLTERLEDAEAFAQTRLAEAIDEDPPPDEWFLDIVQMELGIPLSGNEPRIVVNRRGERGGHPRELDTRP